MSEVREINRAKLPSHWRNMGFTVRAAYLCSTGQARNYSEACSMLARSRKRSARPITTQAYAEKLEQMKLF